MQKKKELAASSSFFLNKVPGARPTQRKLLSVVF